MASIKEKVFALHDFDAENPDEVSFKAGETIIVVEKDDAYGDGWWQGTNPRGETGLFPFSYTTFDKEQVNAVMNSSMLESDHADLSSREANGKGVKATMDDIDNALARMQAGRDDASERTGDLSVDETDEGADAEDDYEKRAKARAALAVNAAKNQEDEDIAERAEQARLKAEAMRTFQEEEEKHRKLLLQREEERKEAAAKGALPVEDKAKEAPIPGVDMSDESDSDGSHGPEFDDSAPTHAPLFGTSSAPASAAIGAGALAAGGIAGAAITNKNKLASTSNDSALAPVDQSTIQQQGRSLSPIESEDAHAKRAGNMISPSAVPLPLSSTTSNYTPTQNGIFQQQQQQVLDDRILDSSSRVQDSPAPGKTSVGTAPTSFNGTDTPKSFANTAQQSPAPSTTGSRLVSGPGGDPHEWTVEQVVEWGRSKGWDEPSVVSKFAEHEISGDVLMEMDANILKEIEITAFGKRFQVANAIKDLKKSFATGGAEQSPMQWSAPVEPSSGLLQQQQQNRSVSQPIESEHETTNGSGLGAAITGLGVGGGAAAAAGAIAGSASQRTVSQSTAPGILSSQAESINSGRPLSGVTEPESITHDSLRNSTNGQPGKSSFSPDNSINYSNFNQQHAASSPRKRESAGSSTKSPADRTSFFAGLGGQKSRKPAPRVQSGGTIGSGANSGDNDQSSKGGTLSRFGLNRLKGSSSATTESSPNQDLRNKISLPTGSPTYDAMGDTARRHRLSQFGPATANIPGFSSNHQKQASMGSSGTGAGDWHKAGPEPTSPIGNPHEGAVMIRIRPVEFEGWMRKKGERYNSWKPRYMALKGSDLVLLRDPTAPKIKGYVNMKGYKVIADENTNPGKYGFKILHESEKPHYFSSDDPIVVREWMKALMKATIGRDTSLPVISSYNNATISLKEAQRMNPPPRPPSPTSRARAQRAAARANKDQLTAKDASVLMGLQSPQERQYGFLQQDCLSSPSVEIDTIKELLNENQKRRSDEANEQKKQERKSDDQNVTKFNWTVHPLQIDQDSHLKDNIRTVQHFTQKREVAPIQIPLPSKRQLKDLPQLEKDESSSSLLQERFNELSEQEGKKEIDKQFVSTSPPSSSNPSIGPTPPSKSDQMKRLGMIGNLVPPPMDNDSSSISSTFGLADLPPPPLPSHSPDHQTRIQEIKEYLYSTGEPPTPISKDDGDEKQRFENESKNTASSEDFQRKTASSVQSYPTLSPSSMVNGVGMIGGMLTAPLDIREKGKSNKNKNDYHHQRRPHSAYEPVNDQKERLEKNGIVERKRSESISNSSSKQSTLSSTNSTSLSSSPLSKQHVTITTTTPSPPTKKNKWWKKGKDKLKNKSPLSYDTTPSNSISEEYERQSERTRESLIKSGEFEGQIIFSSAIVIPTSSDHHQQNEITLSQHSDRSMEAKLKEESKEISLKIKKLFGNISPSSSPKKKHMKLLEFDKDDDNSLHFAGQPGRRRSRSVGSSLRNDKLIKERLNSFQYPSKSNQSGKEKNTENNNKFISDYDSTFDSQYSKSMRIEDERLRKKFEEKKRRSTSLILFPIHSHKGQIEKEDFLTLSNGGSGKREIPTNEAEAMAAKLASFTSSNSNLSLSNYSTATATTNTTTTMNERKEQRKQQSQERKGQQHLSPSSSPSSSSNKTSPPSAGSSNNGHFHLPSWSKWRKEHNRQRESDLNVERLVREAEEEIQIEEGGGQGQKEEYDSTNENHSHFDDHDDNITNGNQTSWHLRHDSREYFGRLRTKIKRKHSISDTMMNRNSQDQQQFGGGVIHSRPSSSRGISTLNQIHEMDIGGTHYDRNQKNYSSARPSSECVEEIDSRYDQEWINGKGETEKNEDQISSFSSSSPPLPPLPPSNLPEKDNQFQSTILSPIPSSATIIIENSIHSHQQRSPIFMKNLLLSNNGQRRSSEQNRTQQQERQFYENNDENDIY